MKISFDFDQTLSEPHIQAVAKRAIESGHEVYITTARFSHSSMPFINRDLFNVANNLGIPANQVRFTEGAEKTKWLVGFDVHFDDCHLQLQGLKHSIPELACIWCREDMHLQEITSSTFEKTESGIILLANHLKNNPT